MDAILIASCVSGSEIAKSVPASAHVDLVIASSVISKRIERCVICIALNGVYLN